MTYPNWKSVTTPTADHINITFESANTNVPKNPLATVTYKQHCDGAVALSTAGALILSLVNL